MKLNLIRAIKIPAIGLALLSFVTEVAGQPQRRVRPQSQVTQTQPLVRIFRGRGKFQKDLPRVEDLQINQDQLGQILKGNNTLVRLSAHTPFVADRGYLIFRTGATVSYTPLTQAGVGSEINGLLGKARFTGFAGEIEIGIKPAPNKIYLLDVSLRQAPNCDRCGYSIIGPDGHKEGWASNGSDSQHLYFVFVTNDSDWYPMTFRGDTFEFEYCEVHEVHPL